MKKILMAAILAACAESAWAAGTPCEGLTKLSLPHTEITSATLVAKGAFVPPPSGNAGGPDSGRANLIFATLPSFCRVLASSHPSADSEIKIEVWIPASGWNGDLEAVGNGGFGSNISYQALAEAIAKGYAGTGTNTGKEGNTGDPLIGHPEKLKDWGYRAVHEMTVTAKAILAAHYGSAPKYSYWNSCSTGGRQGLVAAEYYPDDFDGIAAGDAANPMTRVQAATIWGSLAMNKDPATAVTQDKVDAFRKAAIEACDADDGVKDGIINNPLTCKFSTKDLLCKNGDAPNCFTAAQAAGWDKIVSGPVNPRTGEQIYPGFHVGSGPPIWFVWGPKPEQVAIDTFRALFNDPNWDYHTMDFDKDTARADKLGNHLLNAADETRLKPLFARGGKMLLYHGWNDGSISPVSAIEYYNRAVHDNGGLSQTYSEVRLFMIPGGNHCGGGDGPNAFDKMDVISDWVEHGKAPDQIIATHSSDGKVDMTRPLCPYPQLAKYTGTGSTNEAQNFVCAAP